MCAVSAGQVELVLAGQTVGVGFGRPTDPSVSSAPQTWTEADRTDLRLLRRVGVVHPTSIDDYRANGGYEGLRRAIRIGPDATIREVKDSKLMGRGGAAFPTGPGK